MRLSALGSGPDVAGAFSLGAVEGGAAMAATGATGAETAAWV